MTTPTTPLNNGLTPEERQAYTTNCQGCQNPVTACVCANGPTLPDDPQDPDSIYDYQDPKPSTCPNCGQLRPAEGMPTTHMLTMAPGFEI
jgi:hypothetical protein